MNDSPYIDLKDQKAVEELIKQGPVEIAEHFKLVESGLNHIPWLSKDSTNFVASEKNRALAHLPKIFEIWWLEEYYVIKMGSVDSGIKELVALAVASEIGCRSCVPYHSGAARFEGIEDDIIKKTKQFDKMGDKLEDDLMRLIQFGVESVYNPSDIEQSDIESVAELGYNSSEILEICLAAHVSFKNAAFNYIFNLNNN